MTEFNTEIPAEFSQLADAISKIFDNMPDLLKIEDDTHYQYVNEQCVNIKASLKKVKRLEKDLTKPLNDAKNEIIAHFKPTVKDWEASEKQMKDAMIAYTQEQERKRQQAEAEAVDKERKARERLEKRAEKAIEKGDVSKAENLLSQAGSVTSAVKAPEAVKAEGQSVREKWTAEVTDLMALVQAVAAGTVPINALIANQSFLDSQAKAMKETLSYPGVEANKKLSLVVRS
jgi:cell division septum initiation protein DivIVA